MPLDKPPTNFSRNELRRVKGSVVGNVAAELDSDQDQDEDNADLIDQDEDDKLEDVAMEDAKVKEDGSEEHVPSRSVSPFAALPHVWENLRDVQKPPYDDDDDISVTSGEGETDLSESEHEEEYYSRECITKQRASEISY